MHFDHLFTPARTSQPVLCLTTASHQELASMVSRCHGPGRHRVQQLTFILFMVIGRIDLPKHNGIEFEAPSPKKLGTTMTPAASR